MSVQVQDIYFRMIYSGRRIPPEVLVQLRDHIITFAPFDHSHRYHDLCIKQVKEEGGHLIIQAEVVVGFDNESELALSNGAKLKFGDQVSMQFVPDEELEGVYRLLSVSVA